MMPTIDMLEQEIAQFHQNIQNSNQLMSVLLGVGEAIKSQTETFQKQTDELEAIAKQLPEELRKDYIAALDSFREKIGQTPELTQAAVQKELDVTISKLDKLLSDYSKANRELMDGCTSTLEEKYQSFIKQLEATNATQIYGICQEMNAKLSMKLNIAIGCGVLAVILSALSLILR